MRILLILSAWGLLLLSGCEFWNLSDKHSSFDGDEDQDIDLTDTDIDQVADEDAVSETDDSADGDEEDTVDENDSSDNEETDNDAVAPGFTLRNGTFAPGAVTHSTSTSWGVYGGIVSTPRATDSKSTSFTVTGKTVWNAPEE